MSKKVITFHYTLTNTTGEVLDSSNGQEPLAFLEGVGQIIPGLEKELIQMGAGDKKEVHVPAAEAYGTRNPDAIVEVEKDKFPFPDVTVGQMFQGDESEADNSVLTVSEVTETHVILDGNHPLAGEDLNFAVEIVETRAATADEESHGHAHGEGGHQH